MCRNSQALVGALLLLACTALFTPHPLIAQSTEGTTAENETLEQLDKRLSGEADLAMARSEFTKAHQLLKQLVTVRQRRYPVSEYPSGHPQIVGSVILLAINCKHNGELRDFLTYSQRALRLSRDIEAVTDYAHGDSLIVYALNATAVAHELLGDLKRAEEHYQEKLVLLRRRYPRSDYPQGHPSIAATLSRISRLFVDQNRVQEAHKLASEALRMERLVFGDRTDGHPAIVNTLRVVGLVESERGCYHEAIDHYSEALKMNKSLYPTARFPDGHPAIAQTLDDVGSACRDMSQFGRAEKLHLRAYRMKLRYFGDRIETDGRQELIRSLLCLSHLYYDMGDYHAARSFAERRVRLFEQLYPESDYPDGSLGLALALGDLGALHLELGDGLMAHSLLDRSHAMVKKHVRGEGRHEGVVLANMMSLAQTFLHQGDHQKAMHLYMEAEVTARSVYEPAAYPRGHELLSKCLTNLGTQYYLQGEVQRAAPYFSEALAMNRRLFPVEEFPRGHILLQRSIHDWGCVLLHRGRMDEAVSYHREAVRMARSLYPKATFPDSHFIVVESMSNLGGSLFRAGRTEAARECYDEALRIAKQLCSSERFPNGHYGLVVLLGAYGDLLRGVGSYAEAESRYVEALRICNLLYATYPNSTHPRVAAAHRKLGVLLCDAGDVQRGIEHLEKSAQMEPQILARFAMKSSEAQAMNFSAKRALALDYLLSHWKEAQLSVDRVYSCVWLRRGLLQHVGSVRRSVLGSSEARDRRTHERLLDVRHELASLLHLPVSDDVQRQQTVRERLDRLADEKEELEQQLGRRVQQPLKRFRLSSEELCESLPDSSAFIDIVQYERHRQSTDTKGAAGHRVERVYVAFVFVPGKRPRSVELGSASSIDNVLKEWIDSIRDERTTNCAADFRMNVWLKIERCLGDKTNRLFICADGELAGTPWPAIPGASANSVILEEFTISVVPNGRFLINRLREEPTRALPRDAVILLVGDIDYGTRSLGVQRIPTWAPLPSTADELAYIERVVGQRKIEKLTGTAAKSGALSKMLPKVNYAHIATHGFFADAAFRNHRNLPESAFRQLRTGPPFPERIAVAERNPLTMSGIVLAGANDSGATDGLLTAETIATLKLNNMHLVVLSACSTHRGLGVGIEGKYGLPHAMHSAGASNVVCALWEVDDRVTATFMQLFYSRLWRDGASPDEALRFAQLTLYRRPDLVNTTINREPPDFSRPHLLRPSPSVATPARHWAAFSLSGVGQLPSCN